MVSKKRYTIEEMRKKLESRAKKISELEEDDCLKEDRESNEALAQMVIDRLKELNYLNDQSYLENYVSDRMRFRPRGEFLIKRELMMKGIDKQLLDSYFGKEKIDELEAATRLLESKKKRLMDKEKAYRFLASKGFKPDNIYKAVDCCYNRNQDSGIE